MQKNIIKPYSIRTRIISAFLLFAILQSVLFLVLINTTGVLNLIYNQSYSSLNFQVTTRTNELNETLNSAKSGFIPVAKQIGKTLSSAAGTEEGKDPDVLLGYASEYLVEYLNAANDVSGVFAVLNEDNSDGEMDCVYIRDNSYGGYIRGSNSKIYVCGPSFIAKEYNYQLFHQWSRRLNFKAIENAGNSGFFTKPVLAAKNFDVPYSEMYYWSAPFRLTENDTEIITLTLPLIDNAGNPFGVCGFEISSDFLKKMLPFNELHGNFNFYSVKADGIFISNGTAPKQFLLTDNFLTENIDNNFNPIRIFVYNSSPAMVGIEKELEIYDSAAVYKNEAWSLSGYTDEDYLSAYPHSFTYSLVLAQIIILFLSIIFIISVSLKITHPIKSLSAIIAEVGAAEESPVILPLTNIKEIDELTGAVQTMNKAVIASASRLNTLIEMADISMGGYDIYGEGENRSVLLTNSMPKLIGLNDNIRSIGKTEWDNIANRLGLSKSGDICRFLDKKTGKERWLRLKKIENPENDFHESGVIMDVSNEITLLRKTKYERDYDSLTLSLNRRAFFEAFEERVRDGIYKAGSLIIINLDNLKYINDAYGHEAGDCYLKKTAEALKEFEKYGGLVARIAGDEFILFAPCENAEQRDFMTLKTDILLVLERCKKKNVILPNGEKQRIRFSAGIARYPDDSGDINLLTRYAYFAMFETKHNVKGSVSEFNIKSYDKKSHLISKQEAFDRLIETENFRYMLQPVVDAKTGQVFAYEMFIRSESDGLKSPFEILSTAKQLSKLYYLEIIGMKNLFKIISENENALKDKLIFYNIVNSVILKEDDWHSMLDKHKHHFPKVVFEITEGAEHDEIFITESEIYKSGSCLKKSIDNFGSGCGSEELLERIKPEFIKISIPLIRDINLNANKRAMVKNIIEHCRSCGVKSIAPGIETYEEMQTVRELGADYYQGFYLAYPSYEISDIPQNIKNQIKNLRS